MRRLPVRLLERPLLRPPIEPSCSRWLSCTCCSRRERPTRPPRPPDTPTPPYPPSTIPPVGTLQRMQTPHLPLPPPLPWSPDSQPFLRHMQILSLALLSPGAEESWRIYEALHPDLRPAIPDDIFSSLIARQLSATKGLKRERMIELANLARVCGMDPAQVGIPALKDMLKAMFTLDPEDKAWRGDYEILDWVWNSLSSLINKDYRRLSFKLRQDWLDVTRIRNRKNITRTHAALEDLVENRGGVGITKAAARILLLSKGRNAATIASSLRLAAWCLARGVTVHEDTLHLIMSRLMARYDKDGQDGRACAQQVAQGLVDELLEGEAHQAAVPIVLTMKKFQTSYRTHLEKAIDVANDPSATIERLLHTTMRVVRGAPGDEELAMALRLCSRALGMDVDLAPILGVTLAAVRHRPELAAKLAQACIHANYFGQHTPTAFIAKLLNSVLAGLPSTEAFEVAVQLYALARTTEVTTRYKWLEPTVLLWRKLFTSSLEHGRLHLASRLYADLLADGLQVPQEEQLAMIQAIAGTPSDSRSALLDRHIKDYLWHEGQPLDDLMVAICRGMGRCGAEDAAKAVNLCRRLTNGTDVEIPVRAVEALMAPLFTSAHTQVRNLGRDLLQHVPAAEASRAYTRALSALVKNVKSAGLEQVIHLYRDMEARGVPATGDIGSLLIMALLKFGHLDSALAIFKTVSEHQGAIKSAAMGRLMVNLALAGRCDEAYAAESEWRSHFPSGPDYDRGVYGARLVVDFKAGKDVDMSVFASNEHGRVILKEHEGYKPTRFFFNFIDSLQSRNGKATVVEAVEERDEEQAVAEVGSSSEASGKRAVHPITHSWSKAARDGSGAWMMDDEKPRANVVAVSFE